MSQRYNRDDEEDERRSRQTGGRRERANLSEDREYRDYPNDYYEDEDRGRYGGRRESLKSFAATDPEEQRDIEGLGWRRDYRDFDERRDFGYHNEYENERPSTRYASRRRDYDEDEERSGSHRGTGRRGFAAMDPEEQREISSRGGRASHSGRSRSSSNHNTRRTH